jgi:hypothetical protein
MIPNRLYEVACPYRGTAHETLTQRAKVITRLIIAALLDLITSARIYVFSEPRDSSCAFFIP